MAEYLPPVITRLEGEIGDFLRMIAEARAALDGLAGSEEQVQHAMDAKSAAAEVQQGRLEGLSHALAITAGANELMMRAEEELGFRTTVTSVTIVRQIGALSDLGNQLAITAGKTLATVGVENDLAEAMSEKTSAARDQAGELGDLGNAAVTAGAKMGALKLAEGAATASLLGNAFRWRFWGITALGWLSLVHLGLVLFSAQIAADAIGIGAFGLAATHAFGPVVAAVDNMTKAYSGLNNYQKAAAVSLSRFINGLHSVDQAGLFGVFYQGLNLVQTAMSHAGGIVTEATKAFSDFAAMLAADFKSAAWAQVVGHGATLIRTDLDALFKVINSGINLIPALFHNFNSLGLSVMHAVSGFLNISRAVLEFNPALTKAVALATAAAGAWKLFGGSILALVATMRGAMITMTAFAMNLKYDGVMVALQNAPMRLLIGTVGALAVAFGFLIDKAVTYRDAAAKQITALRQQYNATGNNVRGYQQMDQALKAALGTTSANTQATKDYVAAARNIPGPIASSTSAIREFSAALSYNQSALRNINTNVRNLGTFLGLSRRQVIAYANATGVDLTHAMKAGSAAFAIATSKMHGYAEAIRLSHNPMSQFRVDVNQSRLATNTLTQQVDALNAAFAALITPTLNVDQGAIQLKQDQISLRQALQHSNDTVGLQTKAQRAAATQLIQTANDALKQSANIKQMTGSTRAAAAPINTLIKTMESLHIKGSMAARILRELKAAEDALYNKTITVTVQTQNISIGPQNTGIPTGFQNPSQPSTATTSSSLGAIVNDVHVHLDGREIFRAIQTKAVRRQRRTGSNGLQRVTR